DRRSIDALAAQRTGHDCELHGCIATAQIELGVRLEVPALVRLLDALGQCAATLDAFEDGGRGGVPYDGCLVPAALQLGQLARELLTGPAKHRVAADGSGVLCQPDRGALGQCILRSEEHTSELQSRENLV